MERRVGTKFSTGPGGITKAFCEGLMPTAVFLFLVALWMLVLMLFVWTRLPERTIAEIIRAVESKS